MLHSESTRPRSLERDRSSSEATPRPAALKAVPRRRGCRRGRWVSSESPGSGWLLPSPGPLIDARFLPEGRLAARQTLRACCARP